MFDPSRECPIPLTQVPKTVHWLPGRQPGKRIGISTIFRWASYGIRGVRLETLMVGGIRCTSEDALKRFFKRLEHPERPFVSLYPAERQARVSAAMSALEQAGI